MSDEANSNGDYHVPENVIVKQQGTVPVVSQVPAWVWRCGECGWLGTGLMSESSAVKEAAQHMWDDHGIAICGPKMYGHPGHVWKPLAPWSDVDKCDRCGWEIGK